MLFLAYYTADDHRLASYTYVDAPDLDDAARAAIERCPDGHFVAGVIQDDMSGRLGAFLSPYSQGRLSSLPERVLL